MWNHSIIILSGGRCDEGDEKIQLFLKKHWLTIIALSRGKRLCAISGKRFRISQLLAIRTRQDIEIVTFKCYVSCQTLSCKVELLVWSTHFLNYRQCQMRKRSVVALSKFSHDKSLEVGCKKKNLLCIVSSFFPHHHVYVPISIKCWNILEFSKRLRWCGCTMENEEKKLPQICIFHCSMLFLNSLIFFHSALSLFCSRSPPIEMWKTKSKRAHT